MGDTPVGVCENLLARALTNDDLVAFLIGEQPYLIENHNGEEEPQDVCRTIERRLLPCWQSGRFLYLSRRSADILLKILATRPDRNRVIYVIQNQIWYYRLCLSRKHVSPQDPYGDLFEVDLGAVAVVLKRQLETNKDKLVRDTRQVGVTWNSSNGLQGPLLCTPMTVRDKLDGPDFTPDTL